MSPISTYTLLTMSSSTFLPQKSNLKLVYNITNTFIDYFDMLIAKFGIQFATS